jgi:hypothetical protein
MRFFGLVLFLLWAVGCDGCRDDELGRLRGILVADVTEIDFGDVVLFSSATEKVTVSPRERSASWSMGSPSRAAAFPSLRRACLCQLG